MHAHAKMSAWQREHDGTYKAEIDGFSLLVEWHPEEQPSGRSNEAGRGFSWRVETADGKVYECQEKAEEIEMAMAGAEHAVHRLLHPEIV